MKKGKVPVVSLINNDCIKPHERPDNCRWRLPRTRSLHLVCTQPLLSLEQRWFISKTHHYNPHRPLAHEAESGKVRENGHADSGGRCTWECEELLEPNTVVFPLIHDGTIQGLLEMLHIPYIECVITASVACLDKSIFKHIRVGENLPQTKHLVFESIFWRQKLDHLVEHVQHKKLSLLVFIKQTHLAHRWEFLRCRNGMTFPWLLRKHSHWIRKSS
jgi:hypothetical protein